MTSSCTKKLNLKKRDSALDCVENNSVYIYPGTDHSDLSLWDFDHSLFSIQVCDEHIDSQTSDKKNAILIYYGGKAAKHMQLMSVNNCKTLPKINGEAWVSGVQQYETCYVFYPNKMCNGEPLRFSNSSYLSLRRNPSLPQVQSIRRCNQTPTTLLYTSTSASFQYYVSSTMTYKNNPTENIGDINMVKKTKLVDMGNMEPDNLDTLNHQKNIEHSPTNTQYFDGVSVIVLISVSTIVLFATLFLIAAFYIHKKLKFQYRTQIFELDEKNKTFMQEFLTEYSQKFQTTMHSGQTDEILMAKNMPYDSATFEIPLANLKLNKENLLGSGQFGMVIKATLLTGSKFSKPLDVAVKIVKPGVEEQYVKTLLDECKIMMYLHSSQQHQHIVNLIGTCTQNIKDPYIIIEYCSNGSLDKYLRQNNKRFEIMGYARQSIYHNSTLNDYGNNIVVINTQTLIKWAQEIADGMSFLSSKKVIHGDLAARNVLLDACFRAKISDFGLSRNMYQYSRYVTKQQPPLPWKWMSIECLMDMSFSTESDVWAFGVTLWEIFSLGQTPYPGATWTAAFLQSLKDGMRPPQPHYAPYNVYYKMLKCWKETPSERPSFDELKIHFATLCDD